jgi:hypothetical protein
MRGQRFETWVRQNASFVVEERGYRRAAVTGLTTQIDLVREYVFTGCFVPGASLYWHDRHDQGDNRR